MLCCSVSVCVWAVDGATEVQILTPLQPPDGLSLVMYADKGGGRNY